jgi:hypothetical protein
MATKKAVKKTAKKKVTKVTKKPEVKRVKKSEAFGFDKAFALLLEGKKVSREAWLNNKMFVVVKPSGVMAFGNATSMSPIELRSAALLAKDWFEVE